MKAKCKQCEWNKLAPEPGHTCEYAEDFMTNNFSDQFHVFFTAKKNNVNQWSCTSLKNAEKSIKLFKEQYPNKDRNIARIFQGTAGTKDWELIKIINFDL